MSSTGSGRDGGRGLGRRGLIVAGAALGTAALALAGCARLPAEPADGPLRERVVEGGGVSLRALTAGAGPSVVLLHGASGNARDWTFGAMQAIAERRSVVAFHRPGLGGSEAPPGSESPFVQAAAMAEALERLGQSRPILVGHSYGGAVALAWALDRPEAVAGVLLLAAPSQVWPGGMGMTTDLLADPVAGPLVAAVSPAIPRGVAEAAARRIFAPDPVPPGYLDRLGLASILGPGALRQNARQLASLKGHIGAMVPRYPNLAVPVEILHGDRDAIVPIGIHAGPLAAALPRARLTVLAGIGHMPHHAALPEVLAALDRLEAERERA